LRNTSTLADGVPPNSLASIVNVTTWGEVGPGAAGPVMVA
jgi:hypothetical protein